MLGSNPPERGMLEPSDSKIQPSLTHSQCYGRHGDQGVALFESPESQNKVFNFHIQQHMVQYVKILDHTE